MSANGKIFAIFVMHVEPYFYDTCTHTDIPFGRQPGESPAVETMQDISLACSDLPFLFTSIHKVMHAKRKLLAYLKPFYLYVLRDPFTREIKYVGITSNPKKRGGDHRTSFTRGMYGNNDALINWKELLRLQGTMPLFEIIKKFPDYETAHKMESFLINSLPDEIFNVSGKKTIENG